MKDNKMPKSHGNKVLRLNKTLYRLKQSGKCWFEKFDEKLRAMSFKQLSANHCVYHRDKCDVISNIVIYVGDLIVASVSEKRMRDIKKKVSTFKMKDLEADKSMSRNQILSKSRRRIYFNKSRKTHKRHCTKIENCKLALTPLNSFIKSKVINLKSKEEHKEMKAIKWINLSKPHVFGHLYAFGHSARSQSFEPIQLDPRP